MYQMVTVDKTEIKEFSNRYKNITCHDIETLLKLHEASTKRKVTYKRSIVEPLFFSELNSQCQVNFTDIG
jgi:hypothetical protein